MIPGVGGSMDKAFTLSSMHFILCFYMLNYFLDYR